MSLDASGTSDARTQREEYRSHLVQEMDNSENVRSNSVFAASALEQCLPQNERSSTPSVVITPHIDDLTDEGLYLRGVAARETVLCGFDSEGFPEYTQNVYRRNMFDLFDDSCSEDALCGWMGCPNSF